jgi:hypothetical protein
MIGYDGNQGSSYFRIHILRTSPPNVSTLIGLRGYPPSEEGGYVSGLFGIDSGGNVKFGQRLSFEPECGSGCSALTHSN